MRKALTMLLVAGMIWTVGCGAPKADTPQQAVKNLKSSVETGDKDLFMATVLVNDDQKAMVEAMFPVLHESILLNQAVEKQYGKDAKIKGGPDMDFAGLDDQANYKVEGDKATFNPPKGDKLDLVKKDGVWKITMPDIPKGPQAEQFLKIAPKMVDVLKAAQKKVGKEGYTPEKINKEVNDDMMNAMMGGDAAEQMKKMQDEMGKKMKEEMDKALKK